MKQAALVAQIRSRRQLMTLQGRRAPRRMPRVPKALPPTHVQRTYLARLQPLVAHANDLVERHLIPKLPHLVRAAGAARVDQIGDFEVHDFEDVPKLLRKLGEMWAETYPNAYLVELGNDIARQTSSFQHGEWVKQVKATLAVDPTRSEPWLVPAMKAFTAENVSLIKSIPAQYFAQVESTVMRDVRAGRRHEDIAEELQARLGVSESRAKLIARDQTQKFYSELNRTRQRDLGVKRYVWRSVRDSRVRDIHQAYDGNSYSWDAPPADGHPGEAVNCRCSAEPDLSDIWAEIEAAAA